MEIAIKESAGIIVSFFKYFAKRAHIQKHTKCMLFTAPFSLNW